MIEAPPASQYSAALAAAERHLAAASAEPRPLVAFAHLAEARRHLMAVETAVREEIESRQEGVQEAMLTQGVSRLRLTEPPVTVHLHRELWAGVDYREGEDAAAGMARACAALRDAGLGDLVAERFNVQSLSAALRERERTDGEIELGPLAGAVKVTAVVKAKVRKSD